jgi:hypothetical protein
MATFQLNNGEPEPLLMAPPLTEKMLFLSVSVTPDDDDIKIAGHSVITCLSTTTSTAIFTRRPLSPAKDVIEKLLKVTINITKFSNKGGEDQITIPVECVLKIEVGDQTIGTYLITDKDKATESSKFIFRINFKNE